MISWRMDLTVLTDLSASMFAACFIILLVFLNLAQERSEHMAPSTETIEATEALLVHRQAVLRPAERVEMLRLHRGTASDVGIDVFDNRIEVWRGGEAVPLVLDPQVIEDRLALALPRGGTVRLYVFSNTLYNSVAGVLDRTVLKREEMTVPRALRAPERSHEQWSAAFTSLDERRLEQAAFPQALAQLLEGSVARSSDMPASARGSGTPDSVFQSTVEAYRSLLARINRWLSALVAFGFPVVGFSAVLWIERSRLRASSF